MKKWYSFVLIFSLTIPQIASSQLPSIIDLGNFSDDIRISGSIDNLLGSDLATGDFNGDGYQDILIGAYGWNRGEEYTVGRSYIIFGRPQLPPLIDVNKPIENMTVIVGDQFRDYTGNAVASGDVNGDGIMDAIIGAPQLFTSPAHGMVYIIYGRKTWPQEIDLHTYGGPIPGVTRVIGKAPQTFAGFNIASGDVNGDGFDDVIIEAFGAGPPGSPGSGNEGEVYVLYGSPDLGEIIDLSIATSLTTIQGNQDGRIDFAGCFDVNNDGYWDVLVGQVEYTGEGLAWQGGKVFVVYGGPNLPQIIDLDISGVGGTIAGVSQILGEGVSDRLGWSFSGGDIDGDGFGDLFLGTGHLIAGGRPGPGKMYVLFGSTEWPPLIDLRTYEEKLRIIGVEPGGALGYDIASGDVNGDGLADILVGAPSAKVNNEVVGKAFIIYGATDLRTKAELKVGDRASQITSILGYQFPQEVGQSITAGDVNGDGVDDVIIGAPVTKNASGGYSGEVYVILGRRANGDSSVITQPQLLPSYPNPFNAYTVIPYELTDGQEISLKIYNAKGQELRTLVSGWMEAGPHRAIWNGMDDHFQQVSSGVYFVKLEGERFSETKKILFLK